jgi:hypothetical protein
MMPRSVRCGLFRQGLPVATDFCEVILNLAWRQIWNQKLTRIFILFPLNLLCSVGQCAPISPVLIVDTLVSGILCLVKSMMFTLDTILLFRGRQAIYR